MLLLKMSHCNAEEEQGSPHWDNNFCKAGEEETKEKTANARAVPVPDSDPIFGVDGPLMGIWKEALHSSQ